VTPIQIASAYAAIANGGVLKRPYIVKTIHANEGNDPQEFEPKEIRRVLTPEQAAVMRMMLVQATSETSTGAPARVAGFPVGGKTGTAQKVLSAGGYGKDQYISSFAGFIPATNPKYVIYVAIDNPRNKYYGGEVAAPLFSKVAGYAIRKSGLSPILISAKNMIQDNSQEIKKEDAIERIRSTASVISSNDQNRTPNLKGLTLREVYDRIRGTDIRIRVNGSGRVSRTSPEAGTDLPNSKSISVILE
jgi:cell division protein FtsI (penicillin-binding protein 3)